jgi:hypothetical protein
MQFCHTVDKGLCHGLLSIVSSITALCGSVSHHLPSASNMQSTHESIVPPIVQLSHNSNPRTLGPGLRSSFCFFGFWPVLFLEESNIKKLARS